MPFNDLDAVERALRTGDVACVLAEPVMTNIGVIQPDDGFHAGLRGLTRRHGALLIIDETHTQVACFGGFTRKWRLQPDILTLGKCVGGGVPIGVYGLTDELRDLVERNTEPQVPVDGKCLAIGGTTYGNALNMAAARAALEAVLTEDGYRRVEALGEALAGGIDDLLAGTSCPGAPIASATAPASASARPCRATRPRRALHQQRPQPLGPAVHGQPRRVGADLHPRPIGLLRPHGGGHRDLSRRVRCAAGSCRCLPARIAPSSVRHSGQPQPFGEAGKMLLPVQRIALPDGRNARIRVELAQPGHD